MPDHNPWANWKQEFVPAHQINWRDEITNDQFDEEDVVDIDEKAIKAGGLEICPFVKPGEVDVCEPKSRFSLFGWGGGGSCLELLCNVYRRIT